MLIYAAAVNGFVTSGGIHGDVNANGAVDPADYLMIKRSILGTYTLTPVQSVAADANTDTEVNATDYLAVKRIFLGTYTADSTVFRTVKTAPPYYLGAPYPFVRKNAGNAQHKRQFFIYMCYFLFSLAF